MGKDEGAGEADDREISLSFATEFLLWSTVIVTTLAIEASTLAWLPAFHVAAGLLLLRASALVEHQITNVALNLDIEVSTTLFLRRATYWLFACLAGVMFLSTVGVHTEALVNILTSASFAIGLASQQMLRDIAAGIMVMIWRPFKVGDLIQIEGTDVKGFVYDILLTETRIDTEANVRVSIPNAEIFGKMTYNLSRNTMFRLDIDFDLPLTCDVERCKQVMLEVLHENDYGKLFYADASKNMEKRPVTNHASTASAPTNSSTHAEAAGNGGKGGPNALQRGVSHSHVISDTDTKSATNLSKSISMHGYPLPQDEEEEEDTGRGEDEGDVAGQGEGDQKKKKKKKMIKGKQMKKGHKHVNVRLRVLKFYKVEGDGESEEYKVSRSRQECPHPDCGAGVFMAVHSDRTTCGKCSLTYVNEAGKKK
eukprot:Tamp_16032.p1 GENE.Tamp_16032~~Tamp_16032.p1  ORF type:complete len:431 (+),score=112.74 Tamp_16032:22-1293(+)